MKSRCIISPFKPIRQLAVLVILLMMHGCGYSQVARDAVCVTSTGKKYHRCSCQYLSHSSFEITLAEALNRNYTPCSVCKPPSSTEDSMNESDSDGVQRGVVSPQLRKQNTSPVKSKKCSALTKSGLRCKRTTTNANGVCWQHQ